jgi:dienelactone hydrolase
MRRWSVVGWLFSVVLFCGCKAEEQVPTQVATPTVSADILPTELPTLPAPTLIIEQNAGPQKIEYDASDGTSLAGTFWPPAPTAQPAPGIILMHWNPGTRQDWAMLAALLQGMAISNPSSGGGSYGVFAFDFRGHGESQGSQDDAGYLNDAQSTLALMATIPGVDANRIVMIGASIGADAAVDGCTDSCIGAVALSPGSFLGVDYLEALQAMGAKPVLCVASEDDGESADLCRAGQEVAQGDYEVQIYRGAAHGMEMFDATEDGPALTDLIFAWLAEHVQVK